MTQVAMSARAGIGLSQRHRLDALVGTAGRPAEDDGRFAAGSTARRTSKALPSCQGRALLIGL